MSKASKDPTERSRHCLRDERYAQLAILVPVAACFFAAVVSPLIVLAAPFDDVMTPRPENRIVWPILAATSIFAAAKLRMSALVLSPQSLALLCYLALAGASAFWAFYPEYTVIRFLQQLMIVLAVVLPPMLTGQMSELMRGLYYCFAFAALLNLVFVFATPSSEFGHSGYFPNEAKNFLGESAAVALIFAMYEASYRGARRIFACVIIVASTAVLVASYNKASLGLVVVAPILAALMVAIVVSTRVSAASILLGLAAVGSAFYAASSGTFAFDISDVSLLLFKDPTFTGRTTIWNFAIEMILRHPTLGWGFQSFWLVGPDAASVVDAPDWVARMPHAHNGYLDTVLETGLVGLVILLVFVFATVHSIGCVAVDEPWRAWLELTLALFVIFTNMLETTFFHSYDMLWVIFLALAAESGRYAGNRVQNASEAR